MSIYTLRYPAFGPSRPRHYRYQYSIPTSILQLPTSDTMLFNNLAVCLPRSTSPNIRRGTPQFARQLSATARVLPPIRPATAKSVSTFDNRTLFTHATGSSPSPLTPRSVDVKTPPLTRHIAQTAMPLVAYNTAHSAAPPAPGADFNVLMIGAGVGKYAE